MKDQSIQGEMRATRKSSHNPKLDINKVNLSVRTTVLDRVDKEGCDKIDFVNIPMNAKGKVKIEVDIETRDGILWTAVVGKVKFARERNKNDAK